MYYRGDVQKNCYIVTFRLFDIQNPYISTVFGVTVFALVCIAQKPAKSDKKYRNQEKPDSGTGRRGPQWSFCLL